MFWILSSQAGNRAGAVDAERGERFQICLDASAAAAVRAGYSQCDRPLFPFRHAGRLIEQRAT